MRWVGCSKSIQPHSWKFSPAFLRIYRGRQEEIMIGAVNLGAKAAPPFSGIWLFPFGLYDSSSFIHRYSYGWAEIIVFRRES